MNHLFFFLMILVFVSSCSSVVASDNASVIKKNNQIAEFNVSALSAQVIATAQERKVEIKEDTAAQEDGADSPVYRLFIFERNSTRYAESMGGYDGSLLNLYSIDVDTTCYFCIPRSKESPED